MDFSTMNKKVEEGRYEDLIIFRKDFELICNNCMLYNTPDTIYYKVNINTLELETQFLAVYLTAGTLSSASDREL